MFSLDHSRFREALKARGYGSISQLAQALGMHRNTIHHYLAGRGIFPENFQRVLEALQLVPADILVWKEGGSAHPLAQIAPLVDQLHAEFPEVTFVLFGSRARGAQKKYSDWDIGVFSRKGLSHAVYRRIASRAEDLAEDLPFFVEVVHLNRADSLFLTEISRHWKFLAGKQQDWLELQKKVQS